MRCECCGGDGYVATIDSERRCPACGGSGNAPTLRELRERAEPVEDRGEPMPDWNEMMEQDVNRERAA